MSLFKSNFINLDNSYQFFFPTNIRNQWHKAQKAVKNIQYELN